MIIEGNNLCLVYDQDGDEQTYALRNIDILLPDQGIIGITGPSGSGKSSLLYLLSSLLKPTAGTVYYDNADIGAYTPADLEKLRRSRFGFIFQKPFLIDYLNVLDNVLVGCDNRSLDSVTQAMTLLSQLGMEKHAMKKPCQLSGGQRQKIAVVRALMNAPDIIFADEPTASLDHCNALAVMGLLEAHKDKTAILVITHDQSILENADDLIELRDGQMTGTSVR